MNEYNPDSWRIIKIEQPGKDVLYKVLAGWSGGYLDGDSWKMNSGITEMDFDGEYYNFTGYTGSVYRCHKDGETMRMSMSGIWAQFSGQYPEWVSLVDVEDIKL